MSSAPVLSIRPVSGPLPHLDGLRGVAVLFVLLYHARVGFGGGYVGVDVFLVLSGFLVTSLLLTEQDGGGVSLVGFWSRRIRRLLPVSTVVVLFSVCGALLLLESQRLSRLGGDVFAVSTFSANFRFLATHGDYLGGLSLPSPLLHFWSLALEEQFYVLWPLLFVSVLRVSRRSAAPERILTAVTVGVLGVSFVASAALTVTYPAVSYYLLPTRAWELLAGALLALCWGPFARLSGCSGARSSRRAAAVSVLGVLGLVALVFAAVTFDASTVFPGVMAGLPVLGTLAVLAAGRDTVSGRILSLGPLRWLGVRSYGAYLWHWPLLVFAGASGHAGSLWVRVLVVLLAIALADCSFRLLESPVRRSVWLAASAKRTAFLGAGLSVCLLVTALLVQGPLSAPVVGVSGVAQARVGTEPAHPDVTPPVSTPTPPGPKPGPVAHTATDAAGADVLLLGDSTLAPLRWFVDGADGLRRWGAPVQFVLDAESCRRLSMRSCLGREKRVPSTAVEVLAARAEAGDRFRFVVLMAGYHSTPEEFEEEFDDFREAAALHGVEKVFVLEYRESLAFPLEGSRGERSVFSVFNDVVRARAAEPSRPGQPEIVLLGWSSFSGVVDDWFRGDGIHVNLAGAIALGEFIARGVLADLGLSCGQSARCSPVPVAAPAAGVLASYGLEATDEHCYEIGEKRLRECRPDKLR